MRLTKSAVGLIITVVIVGYFYRQIPVKAGQDAIETLRAPSGIMTPENNTETRTQKTRAEIARQEAEFYQQQLEQLEKKMQ